MLKKRILKISALVLIVFLLMSALFIVIKNDHHNCTTENCCICERMDTAFRVMKLILNAFAFIIPLFSFKNDIREIAGFANFSDCSAISPIRLKVRLNN